MKPKKVGLSLSNAYAYMLFWVPKVRGLPDRPGAAEA